MELRWSGAHLRQNRARTAAHSARERQKSWKVSDRGIGYRMAHRNLPGRHRHCTISPRRMVATGLPSTGRAENCYVTAGSRSTQRKPHEPARFISSPTIPALVTAAGDRASMRFPEFSANKSAIRTRAGPTPRLHRNFGMLVCRRSPPSSRKCRD